MSTPATPQPPDKCGWCGTPAVACPDGGTNECCCLPCYEFYGGHGIPLAERSLERNSQEVSG